MTDERIHKSLWTATAPGRRFPALTGELTVDVVVVGGGVAGLTTAWLLRRAGKKVAVLEMNRLLTGQTGQTTAHLTELLDTPYHQLRSDFGERGARMAAASSRASIEQIAALVKELGVDCGFQRVPMFRYAETDSQWCELEKEVAAAREVGLRASLVREVPLPFPVKGALRLEDQALIHPRTYLLAMADRLEKEGCLIFEETRVLDVQDRTLSRVVTDRGTVFARDVVEATTTPLNRVFLHTKLYPYRTYAVAGPLEAPLEAGLYYDSQDPYHYIRPQRIDGVDYLIVGGEDHKVGTEEDTDQHFAALEAYTKRLFPVTRMTHRWSGQVIEPADGLAYIGRNSASRHTYVATGFSGTGITWGTLSAMILSDLILGRRNPYASLYDATRVNVKAGAKDFIQENAEVAFHFVADRLSRPDGHLLSEVAPGEGKILEVAGQKVAVYREESGACHAVSPVCTHLGCHVHWNTAERSWDCPCHGARYSPTGKVLNGPAVKDLASKPLPAGGLDGLTPHHERRHRMNALELLKEQHEEVSKLFKKFERLGDGATSERREIFIMIADRLSAHATIEEQYFYPSIKTDKTEDIVREAVEEHLGVKRIIADLLDMEPTDENFDAKMKVLMENVEHHVEEEETELFKRVKKILNEDQLLALGIQMKAEFDELMEAEPRNEVPAQTDTAAPV